MFIKTFFAEVKSIFQISIKCAPLLKLRWTLNRKVNGSEFKKRYNNIVDDSETIINSKLARTRKRMVEVFSLLTEIIAKPTDERADEKLDKENRRTTR